MSTAQIKIEPSCLPIDRNLLLSKAIEAFAIKGFNCVDAEDIIRALGGNRACVLKEFTSITELINETIKYLNIEVLPKGKELVNIAPDGISALRVVMQSILNGNADMPVRAPIILNIFSAAFYDPKIQEFALDILNGRFDLYRRILIKGIEDRTILADIDLENIAYRCVSIGALYAIQISIAEDTTQYIKSTLQSYQKIINLVATTPPTQGLVMPSPK